MSREPRRTDLYDGALCRPGLWIWRCRICPAHGGHAYSSHDRAWNAAMKRHGHHSFEVKMA